MTDAQVSHLFAILYFLLATQVRLPFFRIFALTLASWCVVFSLLATLNPF